MTQYGFYFDGTRCTGCKTCVLACKDRFDLPSEIANRQVIEYEGGSWERDADDCWTTSSFTYYLSVACNHCDDPACTAACPVGAVHKDEETGLVLPNDDTCIGCGACAMACPYGAPHVDEQLGHMVKCTGCADRVAEGRQPVCVEACPQRALAFGEIKDLRAAHGDLAAIAPLPDPSQTGPNVVLTEPAGAEAWDAADGAIVNAAELVGIQA